MADGFLGRWSRRKQEVREGKPVQDPAPPVPQASVPAGVNAPAPLAAQPAAAPVPPEPAAAPLPTLQDVQSLSIDSDFKPFASRAVAPEVRNAAMKKLFTDPHFNVMDGLDIYIDDYTQPDPLPAAKLKQMASVSAMTPDTSPLPVRNAPWLSVNSLSFSSYQKEAPRLCRGGSRSLTFQEVVHRRDFQS